MSRDAWLLLALLLVSLLPGSAPAEGVEGWNDRPIQPGGRLLTYDERVCTFNAVYRDAAGATYIGTGGHCVSHVGQRVGVPHHPEVGTVVYRKWTLDMDHALILIDPEDLHLVSPRMRHFGGPTGIARDVAPGTPVLHHGYGMTYDGAEPTGTRGGVLLWVGDGTTPPPLGEPDSLQDHLTKRGWYSALQPSSGGDSGSMILTASGEALGTLEWGGAGMYANGPTFALIEEELAKDGWQLTLQTAPFGASTVAEGTDALARFCMQRPSGAANDHDACVRGGVPSKKGPVEREGPPGVAGPTWAHGTILAGHPGTSTVSLAEADALLEDQAGVPTTRAMPDGYFARAPPAGTPIVTQTLDAGGLGHDTDLYFFGKYGWNPMTDVTCATPAVEERCEVPAGAQWMLVTAAEGVALDVTVRVLVAR